MRPVHAALQRWVETLGSGRAKLQSLRFMRRMRSFFPPTVVEFEQASKEAKGPMGPPHCVRSGQTLSRQSSVSLADHHRSDERGDRPAGRCRREAGASCRHPPRAADRADLNARNIAARGKALEPRAAGNASVPAASAGAFGPQSRMRAAGAGETSRGQPTCPSPQSRNL